MGLSILTELSDPRTDDHGDGQTRNTSDGVNNAGSGEVTVSMTQSEIDSELGEPTATPGPIPEKGIDNGAQSDGGNAEGRIFPTFCRGPCHNGRRRIHEDHLEEEEDHDTDIIGRAA